MTRCLIACAGLLAAGCAPLSLQSPPPHEQPTPAPQQTTAGGATTAAAAIRAFATAYINWSADDVSQRMQALAAQSVGQARSALQLAAAQTAQDYELKSGGLSNRGTVEAVAPLFAHRDEYVVVTRELTSATNTTQYDGLRPAWHIAIASAVRLAPGRWVVSRWQPET